MWRSMLSLRKKHGVGQHFVLGARHENLDSAGDVLDAPTAQVYRQSCAFVFKHTHRFPHAASRRIAHWIKAIVSITCEAVKAAKTGGI